MDILKTKRLKLRELTKGDAAFVLKLMNDPLWLRFIGDRHIRTIEDAENHILQKMIPNYAALGFGFYLVELKDNHAPIGICGLVKRPFLDHIDIGFAFLPEYHGRGYAFESAFAVLNFAKNDLGIDHIVAITDPENTRSIKLLEKLGLRYSKTIRFGDEDAFCKLFEEVKH